MTTSTIYATHDGHIVSVATNSYSSARSGNQLSVIQYMNRIVLGQQMQQGETKWGDPTDPEYQCWETYFTFDTRDILGGDTITSTEFAFKVAVDYSDTDFTMEARGSSYYWTPTNPAGLDTGDWVSGANLGNATLYASKSTSGISTGVYIPFTSESGFNGYIDRDGWTQLQVSSSRHRIGNQPSGLEWEEIYGYWNNGTDFDPKLTIIHSGSTTYTKTHTSDSRLKKERFSQNAIVGTSGTKVTVDNSKAGGDGFSDVKP